MILLVAGTRNYYDYNEMSAFLDFFHNEFGITQIVHGGARGADSLAAKYAKEHNIPTKVFNADWDSMGIMAGMERNKEMHEYISNFKDRMCLCFWDGKSSGTKNNFKLANDYQTPLYVYDYIKSKFVIRADK